MFSFKNFVPVKNRVRVRVRVKGLGLVFRDRVRIRNIIGGAAGAHISMTSYTLHTFGLAARKTPVGRGSVAGQYFGSALLQPAHSVCVSLSTFSSAVCYHLLPATVSVFTKHVKLQ